MKRDSEPIYPFRWNITRQSELGRLLHNLDMRQVTINSCPSFYLTPDANERHPWLESNILECSAKVLAYSDDADLYFVGRSPASIYDYLSAILADTSWADRLELLHFSRSDNLTTEELNEHFPGAILEYRRYLASVGLAPEALARRQRPIALVDIVATGRTLGNLIEMLYNWCRESRCSWQAVRHNIHIIGLTERTKTSPKTWRWQQHATWLSMLPRRVVKNISISPFFFQYLGGYQPKLTMSFTPEDWRDEDVRVPYYGKDRLVALYIELFLHRLGNEKAERELFTRTMAQQEAMRHAWFRSLVQELSR